MQLDCCSFSLARRPYLCLVDSCRYLNGVASFNSNKCVSEFSQHLKDQSVNISQDLCDESHHLELRVQTLEGEKSPKVFQERMLSRSCSHLGSFFGI